MQTKRFVAVDMRRALSLVREELGEDAMILSTQRTAKGVEIVATADAVPTPAHPNQDATAPRSIPAPAQDLASNSSSSRGSSSRGLASGKTQEELAEEIEVARRRMMAVKKEQNITLNQWAEQPTPAKPSLAQPASQPSVERKPATAGVAPEELPRSQVEQWLQPVASSAPSEASAGDTSSDPDNQEIRRLQDEIITLREVFESQLEAMAEAQEQRYQDQQNIRDVIPAISNIKQQLAQLGLTQACNDQIIRSLRTLDDSSLNQEGLWAEGLARLARTIPAITTDPIATGGIYALLGTTGVGKTTTIAKLAARYVMAHGPEEVALITTDTFRLAGHHQLRSLGRILKTRVKVVDDIQQLPKVLKAFSRQALVLIDTPGMSYNDPLLKEHLTVLKRCQHVQSVLALSANSQYQMMQASIHRYRLAAPRFCVLTKLDECASLGDAISALAANNLPLGYITDGQAVPDDLAVLKPHQLVSKAVALGKARANITISESQGGV